MSKLAAVLGAGFLASALHVAHAAPVSHPSSSRPAVSAPEVDGSLLSDYEQDGLVLKDDAQAGTLSIQADPAALHVHDASQSNPYRMTLTDVLSAAATYAYLYFGQHPERNTLSVTATIQPDGLNPVSATGAPDPAAEPAMTLEIARPGFPISADTKPDAYSAQTIGMILDNIDLSKVTMAPWLRTALKKQDAPSTP
ncbi:hypothetical protein K2X14_12775 [Acetobacter sp. TBRC 12305]|uniref:CHRD domain-containing protein n=1 Tax=Acetobacter garciniae TaxID=2817435 RepID=A0A939HLQ4_9PROT|nr:hypothetical protein [Acetobacter garciniae]MBO1325817.1 hypothetical protein [Acetobacter garciniae]MBX0345717.1 hypothetical protein [Acetobacter garciniae]